MYINNNCPINDIFIGGDIKTTTKFISSLFKSKLLLIHFVTYYMSFVYVSCLFSYGVSTHQIIQLKWVDLLSKKWRCLGMFINNVQQKGNIPVQIWFAMTLRVNSKFKLQEMDNFWEKTIFKYFRGDKP